MKAELILSSIFKLTNEKINSDTFRDKFRIGNAFSHSISLSFSILMYFVLQSSHKSIPINYSQLMNNLSPAKLPVVSKQSVSKARQGISPESFILSCICRRWQHHPNF